jgi:hypothetical protein
LKTKPRAGIISALAAFGAGELIAALVVELVAPTVIALDTNADPTEVINEFSQSSYA